MVFFYVWVLGYLGLFIENVMVKLRIIIEDLSEEKNSTFRLITPYMAKKRYRFTRYIYFISVSVFSRSTATTFSLKCLI